MVYMALTGKTDKSPADMAALATADGYAVDGEGTIGEFLVDDAGKLGLVCEEFSPSAASLVRYLKNGFVVIVNVGPGDFTDSGHFFVARGISSDGTIQINDLGRECNRESVDYDVRLSRRLGAVPACVVFFWLAFTNVFVR